jgi:hypothetical protein
MGTDNQFSDVIAGWNRVVRETENGSESHDGGYSRRCTGSRKSGLNYHAGIDSFFGDRLNCALALLP